MPLSATPVLAAVLTAISPLPADKLAAVDAPLPSSARQAAEISVLTYNVRGLPWPLARRRGEALKAIGRELAQMRREGRQPTIILLQEGFRREVADLVAASGYRYTAHGPTRADRVADPETPSERAFKLARYITSGEGWGKLTGAGLYVLSDLPIMEVQRSAYRECAGWDCLANKGVMLVRVQLNGAPASIDVVNTHLNAKRASGVPRGRSQQAHHLQTEAFLRFVGARTSTAPMLIGGDFNVRGSPERYNYRAESRPYVVVSEYCRQSSRSCDADADSPEPWLLSQDLQAFISRGGVEVQPEAARTIFRAQDPSGRLSDHDGYLVRYRLSWTASDANADPSTFPRTAASGGQISGATRAFAEQ